MRRDIPDFDMTHEEQVHLAAESFRLLADPTRMKVLWALLQGESSVACLAELVGANPTAVSQHLAKLRLAGYWVADTHVHRLLAEALHHADHTDRGLLDYPDLSHTAGPRSSSTSSAETTDSRDAPTPAEAQRMAPARK